MGATISFDYFSLSVSQESAIDSEEYYYGDSTLCLIRISHKQWCLQCILHLEHLSLSLSLQVPFSCYRMFSLKFKFHEFKKLFSIFFLLPTLCFYLFNWSSENGKWRVWCKWRAWGLHCPVGGSTAFAIQVQYQHGLKWMWSLPSWPFREGTSENRMFWIN
jgi:hypothetical protein